MKRPRAILTILLAFVIGFLAGSTAALLTDRNRAEKLDMTFRTPPSLTQDPISIELMEKIEGLKEIVRLNPKDPVGWLKLGNLYYDYHHREAMGAYSQYLSLKPEDNYVRTRMGVLLREQGDIDGAIEEFLKVAPADPSYAESRFQLGLIFLQDKREFKRAIEAWEDYLQVQPKGGKANWVRREIQRMRNAQPGG